MSGNKIYKLMLLMVFIGSTQDIICQNLVEDSLGLRWELKEGKDTPQAIASLTQCNLWYKKRTLSFVS